MNIHTQAERQTAEFRATLLRNALDNLFTLRNFTDEYFQYSADELAAFQTAIDSVMRLRDQLTETHQLPRWVDVWGQPRGWEHRR